MEPRPYRDERDLEAMRQVLIRGRQAGGPTYYVHVGDLNWWLFYLNQDDDRSQTIFLWEEQTDGEVIGWALLSPRYQAFDVFACPAAVIDGRREAMLVWAEVRLSALARAQGDGELRTMWVGEHDWRLQSHLQRRGFGLADATMSYLERDLAEPIEGPMLPAGFSLRHVAGESDAEARAAASRAAFASSWPFPVYLQRYLSFVRSPAYSPELDLVAVAPNGEIAAFCLVWLDPVNRVGYFEPVGTRPEWQRRGLGRAVLLEGMRRMRAAGMETAAVCGEGDNPAGARLYESAGFRPRLRLVSLIKRAGG